MGERRVKLRVKPTPHVAPLDISKALVELGGKLKGFLRLQEVW